MKFLLTRFKNDPNLSALFDHNLNTILIISEEIDDPFFESILLHEIHHAFVFYANSLTKIKFLDASGEWGAMPAPCDATYSGTADCRKLLGILQQGTHLMS